MSYRQWAAPGPARQRRPAGSEERVADLRRAILHTLVYADLFDYPLTCAEIQRYLAGCRASLPEVAAALEADTVLLRSVGRSGEWYHLADRADLVRVRRERAEASERLWPIARHFGGMVARLPFVRLVAVTGALAVDNALPNDDVDLFLLVAPGRLWLSRLLVLVIVRLAAARGVEICPNYLVVTDRLLLPERNFFTAHEVVQMVPLDGSPWYRAFLDANQWVRTFLPNALDTPHPRANGSQQVLAWWPTRLAAAVLATRPFDVLERWEMNRKIRRFTERARREGGNVAFSAYECRGHFSAHDQRILAAFDERVATYEALLASEE